MSYNHFFKGSLILTCLLIIAITGTAFSANFRIMPETMGEYDFDLKYNPCRLMVKFQNFIDNSEIEAFIESAGGVMEYDLAQIGWKLVRFDLELDLNELQVYCQNRDIHSISRFLEISKERLSEKYRVFAESDIVNKVEYDYFVQLFESDYIPNDPYFIDVDPVAGHNDPQQWTSFDVQLPEAWDETQGSEDVIIAILDTGVDTDHPDMADNIARTLTGAVLGWDFVGGKNGTIFEMFLPVQEDANPDIHHDDGVDDGWGLPDPSAGDGNDILGLTSSVCDQGVFHGTHCASSASGAADNGEGVAGAGFTVKIMPVRCANPEGGLSEYAFGTISVLSMAINWATDNGADIISMSLGLPLEVSGLHDAVQYAYNSGVAVFAASGNSGANEIYYPASYDEVFAVGSFSQSHERADFSTYGDFLDALAGGGEYDGISTASAEWIWGCYVASVCDENNGGQPAGSHGYTGAVGTSMACPQAAGIAGLVLSVQPDLSPEALYQILRQSALDIGAPGWDIETGFGILQAADAIELAQGNINDLEVTISAIGSTSFPPAGGVLQYEVSLDNNGTGPALTDYWTRADLPGGSTIEPLFFRPNIMLPAGASISRILQQAVPPNAPAGDYLYIASVGTQVSGTIVDADSIAFSKSGVDGTAQGEGWICSGFDEECNEMSNRVVSCKLISCYPNPSNEQSTISFHVNRNADISIVIFNIKGEYIEEILKGTLTQGDYSIDYNGRKLGSSGLYFVRVEADGKLADIGKMLFLK